ncbi:HDOD domain-containing protein [Moritella sp. F3]|uniref:HDOD domain-containing protein n=1 Tax=Moritella sp. F3 TaxID=2718882 RepID=UPI0018E150EA|nr:HDOD domain-containing protein [Moritella sp. F3]GIC78900.1 metal-dependent phosphohydrolase [Moritella sp. F1]GIC83959.1 metal-dependent phosphohydrolase [Moritella sp. F3]
MASLFQRVLAVFGYAKTNKKTAYTSYKPVFNNVATTVLSIPDVGVADEIIDTSSLFYDLLFNNKDAITAANSGLNPLEKSILLKVEASVGRPENIALNVVRLPAVLHKVSALIDSDNYTAEQLAALITQDPVLAADVIKLVNSAGYQVGTQEITCLQEAVVRLGGLQIKSIVLTIVMKNMTDIKPIYFKLFGQYLWQHSLTTALWAKMLAKSHGEDPDLAYFLGLIHDVGKIALFKLIVDEMNTSDPQFRPSSKLFRQMMTKHSLRLSALIAQAWLLPGSVVKALHEQSESPTVLQHTGPGKLLLQANLYSEIHLLLEQGSISQEQASTFCSEHQLDIQTCIAGV